MIAHFGEMMERIRGEIRELDVVVQRALRAWPKAENPSPEQEFYLGSVPLNLHGFYAGAERLFELIARGMDQSPPSGAPWHRDLLRQMAQDLLDIRPARLAKKALSSRTSFVGAGTLSRIFT